MAQLVNRSPCAGAYTQGVHTKQTHAGCFDIEQAQECLTELYNLADMIVPGHDNLFVNPRIAGF